ncbi:MAG: NADH:flavin oxidoreductase [Desulfomonilaceae bacterium]|nr:NADH:flavin oxidoreductase [Desulfomonilaceae bacterium]
MPELFEKTALKSLELENRSVRSATWSGVGDAKGHVTDRGPEIYGDLARGGVGLIITGFQYVMPNGVGIVHQVGNYDDSQIDGLTRLTSAVHVENGKVAAQLVHTGTKANAKLFPEPGRIWGPSPVTDPLSGNLADEMSSGEITQLIEAYAAAASRSKKAGFDAIQLHGAHGYGINQFLSGFFNRRGDGYGGDIKRRYRFLGEVMEAVRGEVGNDFPVLIKLSGHDYHEGGLVPDESLYVARRLADDGIDAIEVSAGSRASNENLMPSRLHIRNEEDEAYLADLAAMCKQAARVPVMAVGGIRSPGVISSILSEGKADYVAMCRPFIREPHLINRWKSGDLAGATCISCNGCFEAAAEGNGVYCMVDKKLKNRQ